MSLITKNQRKYSRYLSCNINKYPVGIYLLKVNNRNTRTRSAICSKLTIKTPERRQWSRSGVFIVNFEHISRLDLVFLSLTLNMKMPTRYCRSHSPAVSLKKLMRPLARKQRYFLFWAFIEIFLAAASVPWERGR